MLKVASLCLFLSLCAAPAPAAWISEVFFANPDFPDAVEIDGLHALPGPVADLVVLDASPFLGPIVRQVVTLPTSQNVLLISETPWLATGWSFDAPPGAIVTLADLGAGSDWRFSGSRTLVLFDRKTSLVVNGKPLAEQLMNLNGAVAIDWVTFQRDGFATAWAGEPVIHAVGAVAVSVAWTGEGDLGPAVAGALDPHGYYTHTPAPYPATPGWSNGPYLLAAPEPAAAGLLVPAALFYARRGSIMVGDARGRRQH